MSADKLSHNIDIYSFLYLLYISVRLTKETFIISKDWDYPAFQDPPQDFWQRRHHVEKSRGKTRIGISPTQLTCSIPPPPPSSSSHALTHSLIHTHSMSVYISNTHTRIQYAHTISFFSLTHNKQTCKRANFFTLCNVLIIRSTRKEQGMKKTRMGYHLFHYRGIF